MKYLGSISDSKDLVNKGYVDDTIEDSLEAVFKWLGVTTTSITDGSSTNPITINNESVTAVEGSVVGYNNSEFLFDGSNWKELGKDEPIAFESFSGPSSISSATTFTYGSYTYYKGYKGSVISAFPHYTGSSFRLEMESSIPTVPPTINTYDGYYVSYSSGGTTYPVICAGTGDESSITSYPLYLIVITTESGSKYYTIYSRSSNNTIPAWVLYEENKNKEIIIEQKLKEDSTNLVTNGAVAKNINGLNEEVGELKSAIGNVNNVLEITEKGNKASIPTEWLAASIYYPTGNNSTSSTTIRTGKFSIDDYHSIEIPSPYTGLVFAYDASNNYLGAYNPAERYYSNSTSPWSSWEMSGDVSMPLLKSARSTISGLESSVPDKIILCLVGTTNQDLNEVSNLTFYLSDSLRLKNIELLVSDLPIDWKQDTGTSTTTGMSQKAVSDAIAKAIRSDAKITTETPPAPYNDIHTLPLNSIVSYFTGVSNVANTPNGKQGTVLTYYCGDSTVICQLYVERDGTAYTCVKWGSTWGVWRLLYSPVEQTTGTSTSAVMSQKAVTDAINAMGTLPEYEYTSVSLFSNFGVVGDSYSSGGILNADGTAIVNCYPISWPQILGRKKGIGVKNYSSTGADIARFLTANAQNDWRIDSLENDPVKDLYVIVMGINTEKSLSDSSVTVAVGTVSDINTTDYTQNADTFCGHYGQMLTRIITHAPTAKIILVIPPTSTEKSEAISDIAELYGLPVFRMYDDAYYSTAFYTSNKQMGHPTAPSYAGMANAFDRQIAKCIVDNVSYFTDYRPQA